MMTEQELIKYLKNIGLDVHTSTKARGHYGFYLKNRIDISKNVPKDRKIPVLLHEFAHYIHSELEPNIEKDGGHLSVLFKIDDKKVEQELIEVTHFVDENSLCKKLQLHKSLVKEKIKENEKIIKKYYPKFMRSKRFKEFEKYIKGSDAKYLMKYDRVKIYKGFWKREVKLYSINTLEQDFSDMPPAFVAYIKLHSYQKKQARISARINKSHKYYTKPTELFARFIEGLAMDKEKVKFLAPYTFDIFKRLLDEDYYPKLKDLNFF